MSVDFSVKGKVAIVTGGSKGIGRAIALALAEHGADVTIAARGEEALASTKREIEALGRRCLAVSANMAKEEDWNRLVDETIAAFGGVDILVNNAAVDAGYGPAENTDFKRWDLVMTVNLKAPFALSYAVPAVDARTRRRFDHPHHVERRPASDVRHVCVLGQQRRARDADAAERQGVGAERRARELHRARPRAHRDGGAARRAVPEAGQVAEPDAARRRAGRHRRHRALPRERTPGEYATGQNFTIDGGEMVLAPTDQL